MSPVAWWASLGTCLAWGAIHLLGGRLRGLQKLPRSRWLSFSGGTAVGYVFVHLLPELSEAQEHLSGAGLVPWVEHHAYLASLIGLVLFYGLERMALRSRATVDESSPRVFWLHTISFALYNGLAGYLLVHRPRSGWLPLVLYGIAVGLHFVVNDYGLREHHKRRYDRWGRWILAPALLAGWLVGVVTQIEEALVAVLFALLSGGIVLNVLKEELPKERESRFWAFALGATAYTALLLATA